MSSVSVKVSVGVIGAALLCAFGASPAARAARPHRPAQTTTATTNPGHVVGAVTSMDGGTMQVLTDAGTSYTVAIPAGVKVLRVTPGSKTLAGAEPIPQSEMGVGDRVLVRLAAGATSPFAANSVIDIAHAAIVARQRADQMAWQTHGVGGVVKSVDAANGVITISSGAGTTAKVMALKVTPTTVLKRYAPDSVDYERATVAPIGAIQVGDQLRALLDGGASGPQTAVREAVTGSFRNIAGRISGVNEKDGTVSLRDLMTKKNVTVRILPTTQMKRLSDAQATQIATMMKGAGAGAAGGHGPMAAGGQGAWQGRASGAGQAGAMPGGGMQAMNGQHGWAGKAPAAGGDPQQMIRRAVAIQLHDLKKGEAIMMVATAGTESGSAITLLAGVEPLLESSASAQNSLMANWSMGSGGDDAAASNGQQ